MYVFREYCFQLMMYFVSAEGVVERIINVHYYYLLSHLSADIDTHACKLARMSASRIHNKLKTIPSKYVHILNRQS